MGYRVGERIQNRWEVRRVVGGVPIVLDREDGEPYAVKLVEGDPAAFLPWLQLGRHKHINAARRLETLQGQSFLLLETVPGGYLSEWMSEDGLAPERSLLLGMQFCDGMIHALGHGMTAHGDVRAENCLLSPDGKTLKITNFGLSAAPTPDIPAFAAMLALDVVADAASFEEVRARLVTIYEQTFDRGAPSPVTGADTGAEAFSNKGASLMALGLFAQAMERLETAIRLDPTLQSAWVHRASVLRQQGNLADAMASCDTALQLGEDPRAWSELAMTLALLGDSRADDCFRRALDDPEGCHQYALFLGPSEEALLQFGRALKLAPRRANFWLDQGLLLMQMERVREARHSFQACLKLDAGLARAWNGLGECSLRANRHESARPHFERAVEEDPRLAQAWLNLGRCWTLAREYEKAQPTLERALQLDPTLGPAWSCLGTGLMARGRISEALPAMDRVIQLQPEEAEAWFQRAEGLLLLHRNEEARHNLDKARRLGHPEAAKRLRSL